MKFEKIKKFVKDHKKEIIFVGGSIVVVVAGIVIYKVTKYKGDIIGTVTTTMAGTTIPKVNLNTNDSFKTANQVFELCSLDTGLKDMIFNNVKICDLGNFGAEIAKIFPEMAKEGAYIGSIEAAFNPTLM